MLHQLPPLKESPSQTAGPYVHIGMTPSLEGITGPNRPDLGSGAVPAGSGPRIRVEGRIFDGGGAPLSDAVVELWQADADGTHRAAFGRCACDGDGRFAFDTVKPGRVGAMAPHLTLWIVARGINVGLHTRLYFGDEAEANAADPVLLRVPPYRRETLIAALSPDGGVPYYKLEIRLQGDGETVFFDI